MKDATECPECEREFDADDLYGYQVPCPHCGTPLDIFPDSDIWLNTPLGAIGIGGNNGSNGGLAKLVKLMFGLLTKG